MKKLLSIFCAVGLFATVAIAGDTKIVTDHEGRRVEVPVNPKRVASLHTMSTTVMLWDLGVPLIGTATRIKADENNRPYIRSVEEIYRVKFQDTQLFNYGKFGSDIEQIKASKPDLIVATMKHIKAKGQLESIAPVVFVDYFNPDMFKMYGDVAEWVGKKDVFDAKYAQYKQHLAKVKSMYKLQNPDTMTVVYMHPYPGKAELLVRQHYGAVTKVAYDLGFKPLKFVQQQFPDNGVGGKLSSEVIGQLNADYILSTYRNQVGETLESLYQGMDDVAPGWRAYMQAYLHDRFVAFNRENAYPSSFETYKYVLDTFAKHAN